MCTHCRHAATSMGEEAEGSDLQLFSEDRLRKKEVKFEQIEKQKREMESKLTEAERQSRSLRSHLSDQQIKHMRCL